MAGAKLIFVFFNYLTLCHGDISNLIDENIIKTGDFVFFPNATVPFFIDPLHFDNEQTLSIMRTLANIGFLTCIKFMPVLTKPEGNLHVMVFENPEGLRKCYIDNKGNNIDGPHTVILGYDCLTSPNIEMMIMKNLGFPFEHNRAIRDMFISIQMENVDPSAYEFFEKDDKLPKDLRALPYDINSVMHFDSRQFSKNGHRTIIIKNNGRGQERYGLSPIDLRKIEMVYGPECRKRDRQEKVELCQNYPGVARRKRDVSADAAAVTEKAQEQSLLADATVNLRVNRDITPPPDVAEYKEDVTLVLRELGIEVEVEGVVEQVHKVTALALRNARLKYCNNTKIEVPNLREGAGVAKSDTSDILEIVENIADYAKSMVARATTNLTQFCEESESIDVYQRSCPFFDKSKCPKRYKSTLSGAVKYSTQHRPIIKQSTKHWELKKKWLRGGNDSKVSDVSIDDSAMSKSALRMGTGIPRNKNDKYAPNYRSGNFSDPAKARRRRNVDENDKNDETTPSMAVNDEKIDQTEATTTKGSVAVNVEIEDKKDEKVIDVANIKTANEKTAIGDEKTNTVDEKVARQDENIKIEATDKTEVAEEAKVRTNEANVEKDVNVLVQEKTVKIEDKVDINQINQPKEPVESVASDKNDKIVYLKNGNNDHFNDVKAIESVKFVVPAKHDRNRRKAYSEESDRSGSSDDEPDGSMPMQKRNRRLQEEDEYDEERERQKPSRVKSKSNRPKDNRDYYDQVNQGFGQGDDWGQEGGEDQGIGADLGNPEDQENGQDEMEQAKYVEEERPQKQKNRRPQKKVEAVLEDSPEAYRPKKQKQKRPQKQEPEIGSEEQEKQESRPRRPKPRTVKLSDKNKEFYGDRRWPSGVIPYLITQDPTYDLDDMRSRIEEVNTILKAKTCASLKEISEDQAPSYEDYVILDASPDFVTGHVGGKQRFGVLELFEGGQHRQHAAMMVMAMLGFYFEVARHDRDQHIRVHMRHVRPDKLHHFEKIREDGTLPLPYDYKSATHPAWQFWRQIGKTGISTVATFKAKDPDGTIMKSLGQNEDLLSELDLVKINSVYGTRCFTNAPVKKGRGRRKLNPS